MKTRYTGDCAEWDAAQVWILSKAMFATKYSAKKERYAAAIEAIADAYVERVEERTEKVYDVGIVRTSTAQVVANSEDEARIKAIESLDIDDGEKVDAEIRK